MWQLLFRQSKLAFGFTVLKFLAVLTFKYLFQIMDCIFFDACVWYWTQFYMSADAEQKPEQKTQ